MSSFLLIVLAVAMLLSACGGNEGSAMQPPVVTPDTIPDQFTFTDQAGVDDIYFAESLDSGAT